MTMLEKRDKKSEAMPTKDVTYTVLTDALKCRRGRAKMRFSVEWYLKRRNESIETAPSAF